MYQIFKCLGKHLEHTMSGLLGFECRHQRNCTSQTLSLAVTQKVYFIHINLINKYRRPALEGFGIEIIIQKKQVEERIIEHTIFSRFFEGLRGGSVSNILHSVGSIWNMDLINKLREEK